MLTKEQIRQVEHSFKHGDTFVFVIEGRGVFVAERIIKHHKKGTIEFREVYEVDETCFEDDEYFGSTRGPEKIFILNDPYAGNNNIVASIYHADEIKVEK